MKTDNVHWNHKTDERLFIVRHGPDNIFVKPLLRIYEFAIVSPKTKGFERPLMDLNPNTKLPDELEVGETGEYNYHVADKILKIHVTRAPDGPQVFFERTS